MENTNFYHNTKCPKCGTKMDRKFEVEPEDYDNDLSASYCYQCPNCKNIEEL